MAALDGRAVCPSALHFSENLDQHIGRDFCNSLNYKCFQLHGGGQIALKNSIFNEAPQKIIRGSQVKASQRPYVHEMIRYLKKLCKNS